MFRKDADFEAFERVMVEAHQRQPIRILSYCVLSNHWHFVAWPGTETGTRLDNNCSRPCFIPRGSYVPEIQFSLLSRKSMAS